MIIVIKVKLLVGTDTNRIWEGMIEIQSSSTLEDFHSAIQNALSFDNDHLYEFFIARNERSRERVSFDDENGELYNTTIGSLFPLPHGRHLYYLFDYGDNWLFKITKTKNNPKATEAHVTYPRLIHETGDRPEQYPEWEE